MNPLYLLTILHAYNAPTNANFELFMKTKQDVKWKRGETMTFSRFAVIYI